MSVKTEIKSLAARTGMPMKQIAAEYSERTGHEMSAPNFSNRLGRDTLKYSEAEVIADILGYEIVWMKKPGR
jgi:hypothetical protein